MNDTPDSSRGIARVLERIERGEVHMRSRFRFLVRTVLIGTLFVVVLLCAVFFASFALFILRMSGAIILPAFGFRGFRLLVTLTPWLLVLVVVVFGVATVVLTRRMPAAYRRPAAYSVGIAIILISAFAITIARTPFHPFLRARSLPFLAALYQHHGMDRLRGVHVGTISSMANASFVLHTDAGEITIHITNATRLPREHTIAVGDRVVVIGESTADGLFAYGVRFGDDLGHEQFRRHAPAFMSWWR